MNKFSSAKTCWTNIVPAISGVTDNFGVVFLVALDLCCDHDKAHFGDLFWHHNRGFHLNNMFFVCIWLSVINFELLK